MPRTPRHFLLKSLVLGAVFGLGLFALEGLLILRAAGAAGLSVDVQGPFAALLAAIRPRVPSLLGRVLAVYLVGGALFGFASGALVLAVAPVSRVRRWLLWIGELSVLVVSLWAFKAIQRPALFDDVVWWRPVFQWLVQHGAPWEPLALAGAWLLAHVAFALNRHRNTLRSWARPSMVVAGAALLLLGLTSPHLSKRAPLVVLIGVDAFRPDRLRALGGTGSVAPHLDAFLEDATLFTRAFTPIAQTEPAWRSLLTSQWPYRTGVRYPLTADERWTPLDTFAAAFSRAGFQTEFRTDCSRFNFQPESSGFARRIQPPRGAINFFLEKLRFRVVGAVADNALGAAWLPEFVDNRALAGIHDPIGFAHRMASAWIDEARSGPALLAYHATAAHFPGDPTYPFYRAFVSPTEPLDRRLRMVFSPIGAGASGGWTRAGAEALYDELLAQGDAQVGILLEALQREDLYDDATIVVFSDHGESFHADHAELSGATPVHGARLSLEENRILLAVKPPRGFAGTRPARVDDFVRLVDIGPTLLELAGVAPLHEVEGRSLAPLLKGQPLPVRPLYAETGFTHASPEAFDADHWPGAPRTFDAYRVRPDGIIEMSAAAHEGSLREKDVGAFDGERWWIRSPRRDGSIAQECRGECSNRAAVTALRNWLDQQAPEMRGPLREPEDTPNE